ncbi:MAG: 2,3-bisphosphoglycerate-dependent phosphoglycerate mutase [Candidatus Peribacteraceae bacterium]|nr:2,3-bisphosphoglycerate-dependent phosphoglycerate mutase [Candidatus Peribacteraceae bacterium]MDD5074520.1 2,3-bisphosphoglycerate-dependent phosphoglycerate mutase [Candidatus Peribacteraceae bacterium]
MGTLILLRHGQSQWNLENRFTGWSDVPLTERGENDAVSCAKVLRSYHFDRAFTSRLIRANRTLDVILKELRQTKIPVDYDSALNERFYGDLQGLNKAETVQKYGVDKVQQWRRSFSVQPPNGESHEDCERRTKPYFLQYILPFVVKGETVLVAAHGNSLRPMIRYLEHLEPEAAASLEIGLCTPYIYMFEGDKLAKREVLEVPGIVTKGASLTETKVSEGRV